MKLPRWLLIGMLTTSALAVLGTAGLWWVTWPERTAREFLALIEESDWEGAQEMFNGPIKLLADYGWDQRCFELETRTFSDVLCGRLEFRVGAIEPGPWPPFEPSKKTFFVKRGRVTVLIGL